MIFVYGASDDLVEVEGTDGNSAATDEFDAYSGDRVVTLRHGKETMKIHLDFTHDGDWKVNIVGDTSPWPFTKHANGLRAQSTQPWGADYPTYSDFSPLQHAAEYTEVLAVDAPSGTQVSFTK
jgi:hypothetical protein